MKISKKLQQSISKAIHSVVFNHLEVIDWQDRTNKISHESWQVIHKSGCEMLDNVTNAVLQEIENYQK